MTLASGNRIGIDLGGTKIEIAVLDGSVQCVLRERQTTPQGDYAATLRCIVDMVAGVEARFAEKMSIGIATPGAMSNGKLKNSNSVCLNGKPLQIDVEAALKRPIRLSNDANCLALSEAMDGHAQGYAVVFAVIIGTGTGAGVVVQQQLLLGANAIAGEWGHNPLPWSSLADLPHIDCYCGKNTCIETYLSGPGFAQRFNDIVQGEYRPEQIVELAQHGDELAVAHLDAYQDRLARSLASVINILDPDVIVLGGGMANINGLYDSVPKLWQGYVFSDTVVTRLLAAKYGDSSGVRGAAMLWPTAPD
ncbi:MAG: ROK family protein [Thiohalomonadales bacterium]